MPIRAEVVSWFSQLVWKIHQCEDERTLFDELIRGLYIQFKPLDVAIDLCHSIGFSKAVSEVFGAAANPKSRKAVHLTAREQVLVDQVRYHTQIRLDTVRASTLQHEAPASLRLNVTPRHPGLRMSARIRQLLRAYFPGERKSIAAGRLPEEVQRWLRYIDSEPGVPRSNTGTGSLRIEGPRGTLSIRPSAARQRGAVTLSFSETRRSVDVFALTELGFTERQCEVAHWLMSGKRDREIAAILGCSSRTAGGYVGMLLRRTKAGNRHAATHLLADWLRNRAPRPWSPGGI